MQSLNEQPHRKAISVPLQAQKQNATEKVLALLHLDICGPFPVSSMDQSRYLLIIMDDDNRRLHVRFLKHKNDAAHALDNYISAT